MRTLLFHVLTFSLVVSTSSLLHAQELDRIELEGSIHEKLWLRNPPPNLNNMNRFKIMVEYDAAPQAQPPLLYQDNVATIEYTLLNDQPDGTAPEPIKRTYSFGQTYPSSLEFRDDRERITWRGEGLWYYPSVILSGNGGPLYGLGTRAPIIFEDPNAIFVTFRQNIRTNFFYYFNGKADTIRVFRADADGDGFLKADDDCEFSNLAEVVSVDAQTTGVPNRLDDNGCTLMDHLQACQPETNDNDFVLFQPTYSGSSYCEQQVVYAAYRQQLIDYTEVRMLRLALMR